MFNSVVATQLTIQPAAICDLQILNLGYFEGCNYIFAGCFCNDMYPYQNNQMVQSSKHTVYPGLVLLLVFLPFSAAVYGQRRLAPK